MKSGRNPLVNLTRLLSRHHAFKRRNLSRIGLYYAKLLVQEPFRLLENVNYRDAIQNHRLNKDPIFIIGHWRSGTSFLQYMLGKDPHIGYLSKFDAVFPDVCLRYEEIFKSLIDRLSRFSSLSKAADRISINIDWDSPSEIEIALTTMISPASPHWGHIFPEQSWTHFDKYFFFEGVTDPELKRWERDYNYLVKKISLKNNGRQLVLKSPGNAARIKKLLGLYPNARFIFIHRNPYDVYYSNVKLWNVFLDNLSLQTIPRGKVRDRIIRMYQKLMKRYLEHRELVPKGQLVEVRFEDFVQQPLEEMRSIYENLELSDYERALPEFRAFAQKHSDRSSSSYTYEEDVIELINEQWKFAFDEWEYQMFQKEREPG